jgi:hypothetical protein
LFICLYGCCCQCYHCYHCCLLLLLQFTECAYMVPIHVYGVHMCLCAAVCAHRAPRYLSTRGHVWTDVDNARSGGLPFVFEPGMSFERYVDYAMDVPMYFVYRCAALSLYNVWYASVAVDVCCRLLQEVCMPGGVGARSVAKMSCVLPVSVLATGALPVLGLAPA